MQDNWKTQLISPSSYGNKKTNSNITRTSINYYLFFYFFLFIIILTSIVLFLKLYISILEESLWWFRKYDSFEVIEFFNKTFFLEIDESKDNLRFLYWLFFGLFLFLTILLSIFQLLLVKKIISTIGLSLISSFFLICAIDFFKGEGINTIFKVNEYFFNPELFFFILGVFLLFFNFSLNSTLLWFKKINALLVVIFVLVIWKFIVSTWDTKYWITTDRIVKDNIINVSYIELIIIVLALAFGGQITLLGVLIFYVVSIWIKADVFIPGVELFESKNFLKDIAMYNLKYLLPAIACCFIRFWKNNKLTYKSLIIKLVLLSYFYLFSHLIYDFVFIRNKKEEDGSSSDMIPILAKFILEQVMRYGIFTFGGLLIVISFKFLNDYKFRKVIST